MTERTVSDPRVHINHRRRPMPSYAELVVNIDWLKDQPLALCRMTETELYRLAESCLNIAGILRRNAES